MKRALLALLALLVAAPARAQTPTATPTSNMCPMVGSIAQIYGIPGEPVRVSYQGIGIQQPGGVVIPGGSSCSVNTDALGNLPTSGPCSEFVINAIINVTIGSGQPVQIQIPSNCPVDISTLIHQNSLPPPLPYPPGQPPQVAGWSGVNAPQAETISGGSGNCALTAPSTGIYQLDCPNYEQANGGTVNNPTVTGTLTLNGNMTTATTSVLTFPDGTIWNSQGLNAPTTSGAKYYTFHDLSVWTWNGIDMGASNGSWITLADQGVLYVPYGATTNVEIGNNYPNQYWGSAGIGNLPALGIVSDPKFDNAITIGHYFVSGGVYTPEPDHGIYEADGLQIGGGAYHETGAQWLPTATSASITQIGGSANGIKWYNDAGLTAGTLYTPTLLGQLNAGGLTITSNQNSGTNVVLNNSNTGSGARTALLLYNGSSGYSVFGLAGSGNGSSTIPAGSTYIQSGGSTTGGIVFANPNNQPVDIYEGGIHTVTFPGAGGINVLAGGYQLNGVSFGGNCAAGSAVTGISGGVIPTCGPLASGAPTVNPVHGANNYASIDVPIFTSGANTALTIAGPSPTSTFSGIVSFPDGGHVNSGGWNISNVTINTLNGFLYVDNYNYNADIEVQDTSNQTAVWNKAGIGRLPGLGIGLGNYAPASGGINIASGAGTYQYNGNPIGGTCGAGTFVSAFSGTGALTCTTPTFTPGAASITDAMLANAYSGVGACTGGQLVSGLNRNAAPTCVAPPATGVTAITAGTGLTGGTINTSGTIALAVPVSVANGGLGNTTAPTAGQVDIAQSATLIQPKSLSGDLTITSAGVTTVGGILTKAIPALAAGYLNYNGSSFAWTTPTPAAASITDAMLANPYSGIGACTAGTFVSTLNRNAAPTCTTPPGGGFTAGGDLSGTSTSQTVIGIQTKAVPSPTSGYLHYSGTAFVWDTPSGTGGGIGEAPTDGNAYLRVGSTTSWSSGGTLSSATGLTFSGGTVGNPVITINHGAAIVMANDSSNTWTIYPYPNQFIIQNPTVGNAVEIFYNTGLMQVAGGVNISSGTYQYNGTAIGGTCTSGQYISALSGAGAITCGTPAGSGGGVTQIVAGAGLTGGTITTTGTIAIDDTYANVWTAAQTFPASGIKLTGSSTGLTTLTSANASATNYTITLPAASGTVGLLNQIQTWTNTNTFQNGMQLLGSNSGVIVFNSNNASTTNYTLTIPANTGTMAELNLAQTWSAVQTFSSAPVMSGASITSATVPMAALTGTLPIANGGRGSTTAPSAGQIDVASSTTAFTPVTMSADCTITSAGAITCTKTNGTAFSALATATTPLSIANGGRGSSTAPTAGQIDVAQSGTAFGAVTMSGAATITSAGVVSLTTPVTLTGTTSSVGFDFSGTPFANQIAAFTCVIPLTIPANFASPNSVLTCGANPAESDVYTVKVNGAAVGTLTISTTCVITRGTATATTCTAGERMEIDAPATVSGSDIAISLGVTR